MAAISVSGLKALADIYSRTSCPRCEGFGYTHDVPDRHDKPEKTRCKKCSSCKVCDGSGVVTGKIQCKTCKAKGFYHPNNSGIRDHNTPENVRCGDCLECRDCQGLGVVSANKATASAAAAPTPKPKPATNPLGGAPLLGPIQAPLEAPPTKAETAEKIASLLTGVDEPSLEALGLQPTACFRCEGKGWKHESGAKHDKGPARCKRCVDCKLCNGFGKIVGKIPCDTCKAKGFIHASTERNHDAPEALRCFFCIDCTTCHNTCAVPSPEAVAARKQHQKGRRTGAFGGEQESVQPAVAPSIPQIPMPPMLPVVIVTLKDGTQVPSVRIPGVGIVPAEQVTRMKIPMVPPTMALPGMMPGGPPGAPAPPGMIGMPGMPGDPTQQTQSQVHTAAAPMRQEPSPKPLPAQPTTTLNLAQREAVLRDVWG
ncbi:hypothetical protein DFJ73DRAFT_379605 [Zopfochytrium polystomum]|nr:hypothetical protein DFJ73DRAFT_379605 [Zopfochytrium polystomum]